MVGEDGRRGGPARDQADARGARRRSSCACSCCRGRAEPARPHPRDDQRAYQGAEGKARMSATRSWRPSLTTCSPRRRSSRASTRAAIARRARGGRHPQGPQPSRRRSIASSSGSPRPRRRLGRHRRRGRRGRGKKGDTLIELCAADGPAPAGLFEAKDNKLMKNDAWKELNEAMATRGFVRGARGGRRGPGPCGSGDLTEYQGYKLIVAVDRDEPDGRARGRLPAVRRSRGDGERRRPRRSTRLLFGMLLMRRSRARSRRRGAVPAPDGDEDELRQGAPLARRDGRERRGAGRRGSMAGRGRGPRGQGSVGRGKQQLVLGALAPAVDLENSNGRSRGLPLPWPRSLL